MGVNHHHDFYVLFVFLKTSTVFPDATYFLPLAFEDSGKTGPETKQRLKDLVAELVVGEHWRNKRAWTAEDKKHYGFAYTKLLRDLMVAIGTQKGMWLLEMERRMRNPRLVEIIPAERVQQIAEARAARAAAEAAAGGQPAPEQAAAAAAAAAGV